MSRASTEARIRGSAIGVNSSTPLRGAGAAARPVESHASRLPRNALAARSTPQGGDIWLFVIVIVIAMATASMMLAPVDADGRLARQGILAQLVLVVFGLGVVRMLAGAIHPLSAIALLTYSQLTLFIARPMYQFAYASSINAFTGISYGHHFVTAQVIAGVGFIAICTGIGVALHRSKDTLPIFEKLPFDPTLYPRVRGALIAVVVVGFALYTVYIFQTGWSAYWGGVLTGRSAARGEAIGTSSGYFSSGLQFGIGALVLLYLHARLSGSRGMQAGSLALLGVLIFPQVAGGSRSLFIPVAIAVLLATITTNQNLLKLSRAIIWIPAAFILGLIAPRIWRDTLAVGGDLWSAILSAMSPENFIGGFVGGLDTAMIDSFEVQVDAQSQGILSLQFGNTYLGALGAAIPRDLWPSKPDSVDQILNAVLFPVTDAKGIGFSFGFYSEPYFNLGIAGVVLVSLVFGLGLGILTRAAGRSTNILPTFVLIMVIAFIFPLMRGSLSFDLQRLLITLLPALVAVFLATRPPAKNWATTARSRRGSLTRR